MKISALSEIFYFTPMAFLNFNGKILPASTPTVTADNRGLRYGDGLFETLKFRNNQIILLDEHLARLWNGLRMLKFDISRLFNPDMLEQQINLLIKKNKLSGARIRLEVIRGDGGLYDTKSHSPIYIIQCWPLEATQDKLNENGLRLCIYEDAKKTIDQFSSLKHNNYLPYFMGAIAAKEQQCNDAVILNSNNNICDSTIANIFIISQNRIITPALSEGPIAGVMRNFVLQQLRQNGFDVTETTVSREMLLTADEVFLTNSIYNIRWVAEIENRKYLNDLTRKIFAAIRQTNPDILC